MVKAYRVVRSRLAALRRDEKGVTAIEYGVIAAVIIVALVGVLTAVGTGIGDAFTAVSQALTNAGGGGGG
ncbi:Flp family type IVb pilin [Elioraea sp. Yellowstone]|jgi:pilus assembly protein Flp/PilA|uniref:Flp family type IVb pilin n=1 Tax=Elioraea sp. Yellowstone TaxID=2592070 RepID=UPI0011530721|nr:Flp family type IVb pilin [Elioraea sp. Yellowstone]TQF76615.1 Flp family type IVb pilin [Elioraea sp. Yellowstone]